MSRRGISWVGCDDCERGGVVCTIGIDVNSDILVSI